MSAAKDRKKTQQQEEHPAGGQDALRDTPPEEQGEPGPPEAEAAGGGQGNGTVTAAEQLAALEDQLLRLRAEFANYKRRSEREKEQLAGFVKLELFKDILPVVDDFRRFFEHAEDHREELNGSFLQGIELIHSMLQKMLRKHGVEPIDKSGVPFDPNYHESMYNEPVDDPERDHTVARVLDPGYRIGELLIRPAKVSVAVKQD